MLIISDPTGSGFGSTSLVADTDPVGPSTICRIWIFLFDPEVFHRIRTSFVVSGACFCGSETCLLDPILVCRIQNFFPRVRTFYLIRNFFPGSETFLPDPQLFFRISNFHHQFRIRILPWQDMYK
jgi:hypothetical protein